MKTEFTKSCGNVFRNLGIKNPDQEERKAPKAFEKSHLTNTNKAKEKQMVKGPFSKSRPRTEVTSGGMIEISITNISALEHDRQELGKKRAAAIAKAFGIHPVSIMYPKFQGAVLKAA